jgi:hypothetical protein
VPANRLLFEPGGVSYLGAGGRHEAFEKTGRVTKDRGAGELKNGNEEIFWESICLLNHSLMGDPFNSSFFTVSVKYSQQAYK